MSVVTITIAGTDRTSSVEYSSFNLQRALTSQVDVLRFDVLRVGGASGGGYKPALLDSVVVTDGAQTIFGGQITEMESVVEDSSDIERFSIVAKDYSYDMDRNLVIQSYTNQTVNYIINDIKTNFLPAGYTITNVNCTTVVKYIAFNYEYPSKCFQQLAELTGYEWYVDGSKNIYFFSKTAFPAPFNLNDTDGNYYYNTLKLKDSLTNLRNTIVVRGGQYLGSLTYEQVVADGTALVYKQGNQYNTVYVKVAGVSKTVGIDNIDDPASFDCLYNFQEKFVRFKTATKPASPNVVEVGGYPYVPVIVKVEETVSVATYGKYEFKIVDKSIASKEAARERAKAEIKAWGGDVSDGTFETASSGLDVGQSINVSSTIRGINEDYVISRISSKLRNGYEFVHNVTLITRQNYGMIEFLQKLLTSKDKEIEIKAGEVSDKVYSADETVTIGEVTTLSKVHNPQSETITIGETTTVQALNYGVIFVLGSPSAPSGTQRQFILDGSPLA